VQIDANILVVVQIVGGRLVGGSTGVSRIGSDGARLLQLPPDLAPPDAAQRTDSQSAHEPTPVKPSHQYEYVAPSVPFVVQALPSSVGKLIQVSPTGALARCLLCAKAEADAVGCCAHATTPWLDREGMNEHLRFVTAPISPESFETADVAVRPLKVHAVSASPPIPPRREPHTARSPTVAAAPAAPSPFPLRALAPCFLLRREFRSAADWQPADYVFRVVPLLGKDVAFAEMQHGLAGTANSAFPYRVLSEERPQSIGEASPAIVVIKLQHLGAEGAQPSR
jgi:hypothetical protein